MNATPRVAVIGCGYWGKNLVRNFHGLGALAAACDSRTESSQLVAQLAPGCEFDTDFERILRRKDISGVVLATPAETHCDLALRAFECGKDVFVEKPLAMRVEEGVRMKDAAEAQGRILMVGHLLEYHPAVVTLRDRIRAGELGKVHYIYSNRLNFGKIRIEENALWSFAPHDVAVIIRLFGEIPLEVTCTGGNYITPGLADVTVSNLLFPSGARAHILVSWLNPFKEQKLVVVGNKKMAVFDDVAKDDKLVFYHQHVDLQERIPVLRNEGREAVPFSNDEPLRLECEHFLACIAERKAPLTDARNGIAVLRVLQACQNSLVTNGRPFALADLSTQ
jgi:predicted dehydrogenase